MQQSFLFFFFFFIILAASRWSHNVSLFFLRRQPGISTLIYSDSEVKLWQWEEAELMIGGTVELEIQYLA